MENTKVITEKTIIIKRNNYQWNKAINQAKSEGLTLNSFTGPLNKNIPVGYVEMTFKK